MADALDLKNMRVAASAGFRAYFTCIHCMARTTRDGDDLRFNPFAETTPPFRPHIGWEQRHALRWAVLVKPWLPPMNDAGEPDYQQAYGAFAFVCSLCVADFPDEAPVFECGREYAARFRGSVSAVCHVTALAREKLLRFHAEHKQRLDRQRERQRKAATAEGAAPSECLPASIQNRRHSLDLIAKTKFRGGRI